MVVTAKAVLKLKGSENQVKDDAVLKECLLPSVLVLSFHWKFLPSFRMQLPNDQQSDNVVVGIEVQAKGPLAEQED